jgi:hypothetical protein
MFEPFLQTSIFFLELDSDLNESWASRKYLWPKDCGNFTASSIYPMDYDMDNGKGKDDPDQIIV